MRGGDKNAFRHCARIVIRMDFTYCAELSLKVERNHGAKLSVEGVETLWGDEFGDGTNVVSEEIAKDPNIVPGRVK